MDVFLIVRSSHRQNLTGAVAVFITVDVYGGGNLQETWTESAEPADRGRWGKARMCLNSATRRAQSWMTVAVNAFVFVSVTVT